MSEDSAERAALAFKADAQQGRGPSTYLPHLFHLSRELLGSAGIDGYYTSLNPAWEKTLGWSREELMARPFIELVHPDDVAATVAQIERGPQPGAEVIDFENRYRGRNGRYRHLDWSAYSDGEQWYFVARDISARKEAERILYQSTTFANAITDSMTEGVMVQDPEGRVTRLNPAAERMLGWSEGELLDRSVHKAIHHRRPDGSDYPVDECPIRGGIAAGRVIERSTEVFVRRDGTMLPIEYSLSPLEPRELGSLIVFRDVSAEHEAAHRVQRELDELAWVGRIKDALAEDRMELYAQPIFDLTNDEIVQHELLLRMRNRDGAIILPGEFLGVAERFGLIEEIDLWVIAQASSLAARGRAVEVNLSAVSIGQHRVLEAIERALTGLGDQASNMVFEVTETALMKNMSRGEDFIRRITDLGCSFALDDFGTGFGSFTYLKTLPVQYLKIDIEFVRELVEDPANQHVVQAVVSLAQGFGQKTIAEGVENSETYELLKELGVDYAQGFALGRPNPLPRLDGATGDGGDGLD